MKFSPDAVQHIYQRAKDHGVIFYNLEDRLIYYTVVAVKARKYNIQILAIAIMFTHIHLSCRASTLETLRAFIQEVNSTFARLYNFRYGRKGKLFEKKYGRSQKRSKKEIVSNLVYVYNNHVEKGLCKKALDERWDFLPYSKNDHPFSEAIDIKKISKFLKKAIRLINRRVMKNKDLEYVDLDRIFSKISPTEKEQFIDYVISQYNLIDWAAVTKYFADTNTMILAIESMTGGEYDIHEEYSREKDTAYIDLQKVFTKWHGTKEIYDMPENLKQELGYDFFQQTGATANQIRKFLHF